MDIDLALLADAATVDSSGKLNILGIFDRLGAASFPVRHPRLALVLRFFAGMNEAGRHEVSITLRDPDGGEVMKIDGELALGGGPAGAAEGIRVPHVLNVDGLIFPRAGRYAFDVAVDGRHEVSIPLLVSGPTPAGPGGGAPAQA
ncbi:MAG: hypothetical protein ACE5GJ_03435 [Gemmatimonadota bacterium]